MQVNTLLRMSFELWYCPHEAVCLDSAIMFVLL